MAGLNVRTDKNQAARDFPQLARSLPSLTRNAINRTATWAEREATSAVAKSLRLPVRFVRNRYDRAGRAKASRTTIRRATPVNLNASLEVYVRGLPVFQVAGREVRRRGGGVKATGGRFYPGAFRAKGLVYKRQGAARLPLMIPKIGLREALRAGFDARVTGMQGVEHFRVEYATQLRRAASRYGVKA